MKPSDWAEGLNFAGCALAGFVLGRILRNIIDARKPAPWEKRAEPAPVEGP